MRAKGDATAAMQADKGFSFLVDKNGINRTCGSTGTAARAQFFSHGHSTAFSGNHGAGQAGGSTGR